MAGCADGSLYLFRWGAAASDGGFERHDDLFRGHPDAVNGLVSVTDTVVVTACEDGALRAVHLYPHRFVGTVGHHEGGFGVEKVDVSGDGGIVASASHDQRIKFWDIKYLEVGNIVEEGKKMLLFTYSIFLSGVF